MSHQAFAMIPSKAVLDQSLGNVGFRLLAILATYRNRDNGWCWPAMKTLALQLGYSEASGNTHISKAIKELKDKGYINHVPGSGRSSSRYQVILDEPDPGEQEDVSVDPGSTIFDTPGTTKLVDPDTTHLVDQTRLLNKTKDSMRASRLKGDWSASREEIQYAADLGLNARAVEQNFRDFWISKPGKDGAKLNWTATWRMWCRNDKQRGQNLAAKSNKYTTAEEIFGRK